MGAALDSLEIVDAPQSWNYVLHDETAQIGYADIVFGAFKSYDWIDLARAVEQQNPAARPWTPENTDFSGYLRLRHHRNG